MKNITEDDLYKKYVIEEKSLPDIADEYKTNYSAIRNLAIKLGIPIRSRKQSQQTQNYKKKQQANAYKKGFGKDTLPDHSIEKIRQKAVLRSEKSAKGYSIKPSGYAEITKGNNKGRRLHVVIMEMHIGRRLMPNECVHHIDENKTNNSIHNLALMTTKAHGRLHRYIDKKLNKKINRNNKGQFI